MGWPLDSLPKPWRIANMYMADEPIQIQMGKKGRCTLTIIDRALPIDDLDDDAAWISFWHTRTDLPESKVNVEYSSLQLPDGLASVTTSRPRWPPVYTWLYPHDNEWYIEFLTESNRRDGDFPQVLQLVATLRATA